MGGEKEERFQSVAEATYYTRERRKPPREYLVIQLEEARTEYKRRLLSPEMQNGELTSSSPFA
jgi:hypothetical protein